MFSSALSRQIIPVVLKNHGAVFNVRISKMATKTAFQTLSVTVPNEFVYNVSLNRPDKLNAFNNTLFMELGQCFNKLDEDEDCRVIVLSAAGRLFTAGLDFKNIMELSPVEAKQKDIARKAKRLSKLIHDYQNSITSLEKCKKPVLVAIHSACIGAGVDLIATADVRYCTKDAWFQVKEVDLGLAADLGTLQRLPKVLGSDSLARELCYTARKMPADEALTSGLVSRVFNNKEKMLEEVLNVANVIAKKSPVAVQTTKANLVYSRDHSVQDGLNHIALLNQMMLQSEDFAQAATGQITKDDNIQFSKL